MNINSIFGDLNWTGWYCTTFSRDTVFVAPYSSYPRHWLYCIPPTYLSTVILQPVTLVTPYSLYLSHWMYHISPTCHTDCTFFLLPITLTVLHNSYPRHWLYRIPAAYHTDCTIFLLPITLTVPHSSYLSHWLHRIAPILCLLARWSRRLPQRLKSLPHWTQTLICREGLDAGSPVYKVYPSVIVKQFGCGFVCEWTATIRVKYTRTEYRRNLGTRVLQYLIFISLNPHFFKRFYVTITVKNVLLFFKTNFGEQESFCGATDTPVLYFWWCLPWVSRTWQILYFLACNGFFRLTSGATPADGKGFRTFLWCFNTTVNGFGAKEYVRRTWMFVLTELVVSGTQWMMSCPTWSRVYLPCFFAFLPFEDVPLKRIIAINLMRFNTIVKLRRMWMHCVLFKYKILLVKPRVRMRKLDTSGTQV